MEKVLVAEIGSTTTVVNAFGDLRTAKARLLGQGIASTTVDKGDVGIGLQAALRDLEGQIGPVGLLGEIPFCVTSSIAHITQAKGMAGLGGLINGSVWPTPGAVMAAAELVYEEVGDVLVFDVGGAATAVYSVTLGLERSREGAGTPQPLAKRTAARDLGVYVNARRIAELAGEDTIKQKYGDSWQKLLQPIPATAESVALSRELAAIALRHAYLRHCGRSRQEQGPDGCKSRVEGRDLSQVRWIIGTGGALTRLPNGLELLRQALAKPEEGLAPGDESLAPGDKAAFLLDRNYVMASLGALSGSYRQGAWQLLRESLGIET